MGVCNTLSPFGKRSVSAVGFGRRTSFALARSPIGIEIIPKPIMPISTEKSAVSSVDVL